MSFSTNVPSRIPIQIARRGEVLPEGLLDDDAGSFRAPRLGQLLHDRTEERGRDREVVRRVRRAAELAPERRKGRRVLVVPVDVLKQSAQLVERGTVEAAVLLDALLRPRAQLVERPAGLGHADDRHVETATLGHRLQRGEDLLVGQIARRPEKHERVGMCVAHRHPRAQAVTSWRLSRRVRRTESASPRAAGSGSPLLRAS